MDDVSVVALKLAFALVIFTITLFAGWYPFKRRLRKEAHVDFPIGETLATGVFLGAALMHMLPEANLEFHQQGVNYPFAYLITGAVFLFFLWFEHLGKELYHHHQTEHPSFALLAWGMLSLHSMMLGTALGLSQYHSMAVMLFLAIITHKWAESFAIAVQLNRSALPFKSSVLFFISFACMTPLGIAMGWYFGHGLQTHSIVDPILLSASAGTFLYLGTLHGLERCVLVERCCNLAHFSFVIIGFVLMASVGVYL